MEMDEYRFAPEDVAVLVAAFDEVDAAAQALARLKALQEEQKIVLKDAAVIARDGKNKLHIKETTDIGGKRRKLIGSLGFIDTGIANDKLNEIGRLLQAGHSVLVVTMPLVAHQAVRQELQAAGVKVISQELSPRVVAELEARLRDSEAGDKPASA